ncbi:MAG: fasciclin domain-containing protein [Spirochaetes bacterium]|uniref:Fasciclin domain-containing protein n=1 Tax=Candidatus Gallitreponema excrementavium TaxID=2840840 RepID=A0A9D9HNL1_9SPIR|nr:fasciclin domain-containing protein [Candidatus Gallitreponema excrementavium]
MKKTKLFIGTVLLVTAAVLFAQESTETTAASATEGISNATIVAELKDAAASDASLSAFAAAVENSPVDSALIKDGITVLVFDSGASDATAVENIGDYIVVGKITKDDLFTKSSLQTLSGKELPVQIINDKFVVNGVEVVSADALTTDSVIVHKIAKPFESNL